MKSQQESGILLNEYIFPGL